MQKKQPKSKSQEWFWSDEWQKGEREADEALASGEIVGPFDNIDDAMQALKRANDKLLIKKALVALKEHHHCSRVTALNDYRSVRYCYICDALIPELEAVVKQEASVDLPKGIVR
jgi:hypothetical protein